MKLLAHYCELCTSQSVLDCGRASAKRCILIVVPSPLPLFHGTHSFFILLFSFITLLTIPACTSRQSTDTPPILLFNGTGSSSNDVKAIETILQNKRLAYTTADSQQLNSMSVSNLTAYRLMIIPGGHYINMGNSLTTQATANIHTAVQNGLNYLGICAGGLLAGKAKSNSINLTHGVEFGFYSIVNSNVHKALVPITSVNSPPIEHYWEDGPQFTGWGTVVAKYPDATPAVVQGTSGNGWVILCGTHPEAPESWRDGMTFTSLASSANTYAATLIDAALNRTSLPHY
jgi:hypothetical protein